MAAFRQYCGARGLRYFLRYAGGWRQPFSVGAEPAVCPVRREEQWPGPAAVRSCDSVRGQFAVDSAEYLFNAETVAKPVPAAVEYIAGISNPASFPVEPFLLRAKRYAASPANQPQPACGRSRRVVGRAAAISCFQEYFPIRNNCVFNRACSGSTRRAAVPVGRCFCRILSFFALD